MLFPMTHRLIIYPSSLLGISSVRFMGIHQTCRNLGNCFLVEPAARLTESDHSLGGDRTYGDRNGQKRSKGDL